MAVLEVNLVDSYGGGTLKERSYTSIYEVITDITLHSPLEIRSASDGIRSIPNFNAVYQWLGQTDDGAVVVSKVAQRRDSDNARHIWRVTVEYGPRTRNCQTSDVTDPMQEPPTISGGFATYRKPVYKDHEDKPIVTSAGEPYDPVIEIDDSRATVIITRNESSLNASFLADYKDAINSDAIWGLSEFQVKMANISWSKNFRGTCSPFWTITYEIHIAQDENGWKKKLIDWGWRKFNSSTNKLEPILIEGKEPLQPVFLNGQGQPINGNGKLNAGQDPFENEFQFYKEMPFLALQLPDPFS